MYELHATTENGKPSSSVFLHYRARVNQSTGEDWKDTALTVSTVASGATSIPQLGAIKMRPRSNFLEKKNMRGNTSDIFGRGGLLDHAASPPVQTVQTHQASIFGQLEGQEQQFLRQRQQQPTSFVSSQPIGSLFGNLHAPALGGALHEDFDDIDSSSFEEVSIPSAIVEPTTVITETPLAISYSVEGESTIPSDGVTHQVSVAVLPFIAKISHVTIPRIEPRVYLQVISQFVFVGRIT
jgi:hypothetical protein